MAFLQALTFVFHPNLSPLSLYFSFLIFFTALEVAALLGSCGLQAVRCGKQSSCEERVWYPLRTLAAMQNIERHFTV